MSEPAGNHAEVGVSERNSALASNDEPAMSGCLGYYVDPGEGDHTAVAVIAKGGLQRVRHLESGEEFYVDDFGVERVLRLLDDGTTYEGVHDTGHGPEPYWLQASVVATWERIA